MEIIIELDFVIRLRNKNTRQMHAYFNSYKPYLKRIDTTYNLCRNPLPVPAVNHMYAESLLIYRN